MHYLGRTLWIHQINFRRVLASLTIRSYLRCILHLSSKNIFSTFGIKRHNNYDANLKRLLTLTILTHNILHCIFFKNWGSEPWSNRGNELLSCSHKGRVGVCCIESECWLNTDVIDEYTYNTKGKTLKSKIMYKFECLCKSDKVFHWERA